MPDTGVDVDAALDLPVGDSETMGEDVSFRNAALNLVEVDLD